MPDYTTADILSTYSKPTPNDIVMALARNLGKNGLNEIPKSIYRDIERGVTQGPYSSPTGEFDPGLALRLGPGLMAPGGIGRMAGATGAELGVFGSSVRKGRVGHGAGALSDQQMQSTLDNLVQKHWDAPNKQKTIINEFRAIHPEYEGSDATINRIGLRLRNKQLIEPSMYSGSATDKAGGEFELGAFGGRGKITNSQAHGAAENINWLQSQRPVDEAWVKNWLKDAGVPIKAELGNDTKYIRPEMLNPPLPGNKPLTIRVPADEGKHLSTWVKPSEESSYIDTGYGRIKPGGGGIVPSRIPESTTTNEIGMSYSNPQALDARLKYELHKAPFGGNWLIPEEMAPRIPIKKTPELPQMPQADPNQLKLLSQGFTPADILNVLRQQNGHSQEQ